MTNQGNEVKIEIIIVKCVPKKVDWAKYLNRQSSKSIQVIKLSFCQNDSPMGESLWQKDSFITHLLFELCLFSNSVQSTFFGTHFTTNFNLKFITES